MNDPSKTESTPAMSENGESDLPQEKKPAGADSTQAKVDEKKRKADGDVEADEDGVKKINSEGANDDDDEGSDKDGLPHVPASKEGTSYFIDADVLSGRGGGTNVHPGNRNFRDLINLHRRAYLKARKNDKPAISRNIVRAIRENQGRFLKKDEKSGLWFEIGDDAAREKTSQALRQRAPEMRKLLFDTERDEARVLAEEQMRQQRLFMNMAAANGAAEGMMAPGAMPGMMNPAFMAMTAGGKMPQGQDYSQMFSNAFMGPNATMNRFGSGGNAAAPTQTTGTPVPAGGTPAAATTGSA